MILRDLAARSRATPAFQAAIETFLHEQRPNDAIRFDEYAPPVKVERTLTQLLARHPELAVERVSVEGASGCAYFRGELHVLAAGEELRIHFHWDCKWKAQQQGWTDCFGFPDQIRAAREFGYDCFRQWEPEAAPSIGESAGLDDLPHLLDPLPQP